MTYTDNDNILRSYGYTYDEMNRLKGSYYQKEYTETNSYDEHLTYDKNGNILTLNRNGFVDGDTPGMQYPIDDLSYFYANNYKSNRFVSVVDHSNSIDGFKDGNLSGVDYEYDDFGNMIRDRNKGIDKIIYNHLNLPIKIVFSNSSEIHYIYNAVGSKIRKRVVSATPGYDLDGDTHYISGFQYKNNELQFFPTAEGYVNVTDGGKFNYVYNYTDHLGNVRLSYAYNDATSELSILEENHYYPFGLKHNNYNIDRVDFENDDNGGLYAILKPVERNKYQYKYNGKEYQDELGLNFYDYGARNYDPAIGRWMNIDPLAETSRRFSPYTYCLNNPVYYIDPDGMMAVDGDPVKTVVHSNQTSNTFSYDDKGKTVGTDKIQQTVVSTMTVTNSDGQAIQTMNTTTMTTAYVDSEGNTNGQATEYSTNSINTKNEDGTWTRTDAIETSKTLDLKETSKELQSAVKEVQNFKKEEKISPVQAEARQNASENKTACTIGGALGTLGRAIAQYVPHPAGKGAGTATAGVGATVATVPQLTNPTNPERIALRKTYK